MPRWLSICATARARAGTIGEAGGWGRRGPGEAGPDAQTIDVLNNAATLQLKELYGVLAQQIVLGFVSQPELLDLIQTRFPRQAVGAPQAALLPKAVADVLDDLRLQILRIPRIDAEPDVFPLVASRDQLLDPRPAGVRADHLQVREVARDLVEVHGPAVLARHAFKDVSHLHGNRYIQLDALRE